MPLHLRPLDATDRDMGDAYVVMTGGYCVGSFRRLTHSAYDGDWAWAVSFGHPIDNGGRVGTAREAENAIAVSFRRQLARIGLAEAEGSRPLSLMRGSVLAAEAHREVPRCDWDFDREQSRVLDRPRIARITSGDLPVGLLREVAFAPAAGHWTWAISGTRHNPPGFVWNGCTPSLEESQDALLHAWSAWIAWAGLRQVRAPEMSRPIRSLC